MKYLKIILTVAVILSVVFAFCTGNKVTKSEFLLDTYITITAYGKNADKAINAAISKTKELESKLSCFNHESEIYKINNAKYGTPTKVSSETLSLIKKAQKVSEETNGAFDITVKPLMDLWGFGQEKNRVPTDDELVSTINKVNYKYVYADEKSKTVTLTKEGMAIDLGGIAKGYAADCAAKILKDYGIKSAYLDFGGNVLTIGKRQQSFVDKLKNKQKDYNIGVQNPTKERGTSFYTVAATKDVFSVVTSGTYERNFQKNGKTYHHIIDPKTGKQPENNILSVTVTGGASYMCDALSTAFFVGGVDLANENKDKFTQAIFYLNTGEIINITGEN